MDRLVRAAFGLPRRRKGGTPTDEPGELPTSIKSFDRKKSLGIMDWYSASWQGDLSVFTATKEDVWYKLTVSMAFKHVIMLELLVETLIIVVFALLLWALAQAQCDGEDCAHSGFQHKLALSLSSVRLSSDSIFGWQERTPSTAAEVTLLVAEGWIHWLLLNVAGAIIVARALLPHKQLAFAHTCAVDTDNASLAPATVYSCPAQSCAERAGMITGARDSADDGAAGRATAAALDPPAVIGHHGRL